MAESVELLVKQILEQMNRSETSAPSFSSSNQDEATANDYPIAKKHPDWIKIGDNKKFEDVTLENILSGRISSQDLRIKPEILIKQGEIAKNSGREAIQYNFSRAAELSLSFF